MKEICGCGERKKSFGEWKKKKFWRVEERNVERERNVESERKVERDVWGKQMTG